jgi:hypothetical protein
MSHTTLIILYTNKKSFGKTQIYIFINTAFGFLNKAAPLKVSYRYKLAMAFMELAKLPLKAS